MPTLATMLWWFSSVNSLVYVTVGPCSEVFYTLGAPGSFSSVNSLVCFKVVICCEVFSTLVTVVWSLSSVNSLVNFKVGHCSKVFSTQGNCRELFPVWILWCISRPFVVKCFPHWSQWYGLSPVWILWILRWDIVVKCFPHRATVGPFSSVNSLVYFNGAVC